MSYQERIYYFQSLVWYYYIMLDFEQCYEAALQWIKVFEDVPHMKEQDPDLYMRGYHYILTSCFNLKRLPVLNQHLSELENFRKIRYSRFNLNSKIISFLYVHHSRMNRHFLQGTFKEGIVDMSSTKRRLNVYKTKLDMHHVMVFNYKIAAMHLMAGEPDTAIKYLNVIINMEVGALREDIQGYARLMFLMAHYDLGNIDFIPYLLRNTSSFFNHMEGVTLFHKATIEVFEKLGKSASLKERKSILKSYDLMLEGFKQEKYERRTFLYLDMSTWVRQKLM